MAIKWGKTHAISLSRGGQTTKIHILTDILGRLAVIRLTPGNVSDIRIADKLIEVAGPVRRLIVDCGYDVNRVRCVLQLRALSAALANRLLEAKRCQETAVAPRWSKARRVVT
jgi:transposase